MQRIRGKLTYANVISTLCLILLVGGGTAYAATEMLPKNSVGSKQIKKEAVTPAKLSKASKAALTGPQGPQGSQGPQGPKGEKGDKGDPGPLLESLPSGKTERGVYSFAGVRPSTGGYVPSQGYSFPVPLTTTPTAHLIADGSPTTECPGSAGQPTAAPGQLCLYETRNDTGHLYVELEDELGRYGFGLFAEGVANGANFEFQGTWAVTAP